MKMWLLNINILYTHEIWYVYRNEERKKHEKPHNGPVLGMNNNAGVKVSFANICLQYCMNKVPTQRHSWVAPVQMYQVTLKPGFCGQERCGQQVTQEVSRRYRSEWTRRLLPTSKSKLPRKIFLQRGLHDHADFLSNSAIQVKPYAIGPGELLFVDSDG